MAIPMRKPVLPRTGTKTIRRKSTYCRPCRGRLPIDDDSIPRLISNDDLPIPYPSASK